MQFKFEEKELRIDQLVPNDGQVKGVPRNPRFIRDSRFEALKKSIADTPEMLQLRELIVYPLYTGKFCILAGNMRFRAARELGVLKFRCKIVPASTPSETLRAFVVKDNIAFGQDDLDLLANDWDFDELKDFGFDGLPEEGKDENSDGKEQDAVKQFLDENAKNDENGESEEEKEARLEDERVPDILFPSDNSEGIPVLDLSKMPETFPLPPFTALGERRGWLTETGTLHFYIQDVRFFHLWQNPNLILGGSIRYFVEPNFSLYGEMPRAYAYFATYKKRWLARYWQDKGLLPFVDLNVNPRFADINLLGVPQGWRAFATRGYASDKNGGTQDLDLALKTALSFHDNPLLVVYAGGKIAQEWCEQHAQNALFVPVLSNKEYAKEKEIEQAD